MQPTLCARCKKNMAVIFITRIENNESRNEGLCLKCARELHIKPVDDVIEKMGLSDDDLESITGDMMEMFRNAEELPDLAGGDADGDEEDDDGKTATFPFLNRLFGNSSMQPVNDQSGETRPPKETPPARDGKEQPRKHKFLDSYCINLTARARDGKLDSMIGRAEELERVIQILNRRQKNNPCLIGEPGVGKTAIAEGLAQRIAAGDVPYKLRDKEVYLLDLTALVAGTQFRGQFESRMKGLIDDIRKIGNVILVIDEVHNIVGAGDAEGSMNAANILKPALSRGEIQVIGATTFTEYRKHIEKDSALERRFQPVTVTEPSLDDSVEILKGIRHYYEDFHDVTITDEMCRQAVLLSERYITDRFLPDKAIDLIDEACSDVNLKNPDLARREEIEKELADYDRERELLMQDAENEHYERMAELRSRSLQLNDELTQLKAKGRPELTAENLARIIEMWTKIPASSIREDEFERLAKLNDRLKANVVGQDEAVDAVCAAIRRHRRWQDGAGQAARGRPLRLAGVAHPAGYVGVYGEVLRLAADRLASGLCGV